MTTLRELKGTHERISPEIEGRLNQFKELWKRKDDEAVLEELVFCLLTPQSKARTCWAAVERMVEKNVLSGKNKAAIEKELRGVRFHRNKARYIVEALGKFRETGIRKMVGEFKTAEEAREWVVKNVKGLGYKEASHFLRNIGFSDELAILDRHVLKNLKALGVIEEVPKSLTRKKYLEIEGKMREFSEKAKIKMGHLDLVLWYNEAGEVFK